MEIAAERTWILNWGIGGFPGMSIDRSGSGGADQIPLGEICRGRLNSRNPNTRTRTDCSGNTLERFG
jgi:hypothetical protein